MDAKLKAKIKGRVLTLINKIDELKQIGYEDSEIAALLPALEGWEDELMNIYAELGV